MRTQHTMACFAMAWMLGSVGCAGSADEFGSAAEEDIATTEGQELSFAHRPKLEVRLGKGSGVAMPEEHGSACVSSTLRVVPRLQAETAMDTWADVTFVDHVGGSYPETLLETYYLPKAGLPRRADQPEKEIVLERKLGALARFQGHYVTVRVVQRRKSGRVVGHAELTFKFMAPSFNLWTVKGYLPPDLGPTGALVFSGELTYPTWHAYASGPTFMCDDMVVRADYPGGSYILPVDGGVLYAKTKGPVLAEGPWVDSTKAPFAATLVSAKDGHAYSATMPIKY